MEDIEEGSRGAIVVGVEVGIVEEIVLGIAAGIAGGIVEDFVRGIAVGIVGVPGSLAGWWW